MKKPTEWIVSIRDGTMHLADEWVKVPNDTEAWKLRKFVEKAVKLADEDYRCITKLENRVKELQVQLANKTPGQTHTWYCEACAMSVDVTIEEMQSDDLNGDQIWGDVVCDECKLVIATIRVSEPGVYDLVKIGPGSGKPRNEDD